MHRSFSPFLLLGGLAGCSSAELPPAPAERATEPTPAEPSPSPAPAPSPADRATEPTPAEPSLPAADRATEPTPAGSTPSSLRVVAIYEGALDLLTQRDAPVLTLDGRPVPWVEGRFTADPRDWRGLEGIEPERDDDTGFYTYVSRDLGTITSAVGGLAHASPQVAWLTTEHHAVRSWSSYSVRAREGDGWRDLDLVQGPLSAYYQAYAERDGALFGFRQWAFSGSVPEEPLDDGAEPREARRAVAKIRSATRRLEESSSAWVWLGGAKVAAPRMPSARVAWSAATGTLDGSLYAVAPGGRLAWWPPAESEPTLLALPGLDSPFVDVTLSASGEWVVAYGDHAYLAVGRPDQWQEVPRPAERSPKVRGAARAAGGELWIAFGASDAEALESALWRKPVEGSWVPVPLPDLELEALRPRTEWTYGYASVDAEWKERTISPIGAEPAEVAALVGGLGAVWLTLGLHRRRSEDLPVMVVATNHEAAAGPPTVLPPAWKVLLQSENETTRHEGTEGDACSRPSLLLGPASLATERPELVAILAGLELPPGTLGATYVGELDGAEVLVTRANVDVKPSRWDDAAERAAAAAERAAAAGLRQAAAEATGLPVTLDCRVPLFVAPVK
jgi:hypothetical protein